MDFRSFKKNHPTQSDKSPSEEDIRKTAKTYEGKSDDEMLAEILKMANKGQRDGSFSEAKLDEFVRNVSPILNEKQRERLQKVLSMLRRN